MNSRELALSIKKRCLELSYRKRSSHLGGSLSVADILAVLYADILKHDPKNPMCVDRDRLFYSKGHACMALYSCLESLGFFENLLENFTRDGQYFTSHVNHKVPGIELSTGSLGHALSVAVGVALAGKRQNKTWRTFCIVSDGELDEGSNWEAILMAPHLKLDRLCLIVDYNKIQSFGRTNEIVNLEPLHAKFTSFNWNVIEIDGHAHDQLVTAFKSVTHDRPTVVIAHTIKGKGVSFMEDQLEWHYKSPSEQQYLAAIGELEQT